MREIVCNPRLRVAGTQASCCLWASNSSFIVPTGLDKPLFLAKIKKNNIITSFIFTCCKDVRYLPQLFRFNHVNVPNFTCNYSGCFFTGKKYEDLLFWISNCIENVIIFFSFLFLFSKTQSNLVAKIQNKKIKIQNPIYGISELNR